MNPTRDKFIVEWFGECWHEYLLGGLTNACGKCGQKYYKNRDFSTWSDFGWLWGKCIKQDWWIDFVTYYELETVSSQ
jgi:hypothetical protein